MGIFISPSLKESILKFGLEGEHWLNSLPEHVAELKSAWEIQAEAAFDHSGAVSWTAPVILENGSQAVLKVGFPHEESRFEADALRLLDGQGAVRLLRSSPDGFSLLLERCLPGTDLWSLPEEQADAVAAELLPRLWREAISTMPFPTLGETTTQWWTGLPRVIAVRGYEPEWAAYAIDLCRELLVTSSQSVLLHGDFHPGNVLASEREPWLAIDPKPILGDPAYDLAQWLFDRYAAAPSDNRAHFLCKRINYFADVLALDPARIAGWAYIKSIGWEWEREVVQEFLNMAKSWA